ncbi:HTH-type transcriptional regulator TreR [Halolactibacillus alkaliphilus]|uniref:Trehalose operon repressor n=1 Tax=Halolactibacillus alkaliphilus TaxID=442899 RepID=A0A511WXS3_9BACI|nr:trehalose operon repressor [Halolactibacillus alkaliphilus]GEN55909.1 HTH-type transcriptional regulator TreR [Halolactibacillus alkaliphilus]GGN65645.1 HTH-type transcriptional regulator TreR [Halolactibacillus alkaliphilus]
MQNKYLVIYQDLLEQIEDGIHPVDSYLPSENELKTQYETSRETVRKALTLLSQNGYIQKVRGKGSVVLPRNKFDFPVSGLVSFKELQNKLGEDVQTHVLTLNTAQPSRHIKKQLLLENDDQLVTEVIRTREINGERVILDKDYFLSNKVEGLTESIAKDSIYQYLEDTLKLSISFAKKEITVEDPTEEDRLSLDLTGFHNIVVIKNYVYLDDATLFQYTESRHRPDRFRFVDFARRHH